MILKERVETNNKYVGLLAPLDNMNKLLRMDFGSPN